MPQESPIRHNAETLPEPLIVPSSEHVISQNNIDREALKVMYRLRDAGFSAYLVGGGVRDLYMGKEPKDFDVSTDARPGQLRKLFRNSRIIGRRFRLVQVIFRGNKIIEVSTLRCRSEYDLNGQDEVLASNNTFGTLAEDAFRRDLTINSLFYEIENSTIIDYTGGVDDLQKGIIRIVGDPHRRIVRDPVRMMRAIRHAARSGFTIEDETWQAIVNNHDKLDLCPDSRIRDEFFKDLHGSASRRWFELAVRSGVFQTILPCYKNVDLQYKEDLGRLLGIVDRLVAEGGALPEQILLALVMIPWAKEKLNLMAAPIKGAEAFEYSREVRKELRNNLAHLNVKRAIQEIVTGLLVGLPLLHHHAKGEKWPRRLARKSYFKEALKFYKIYSEINGGEKVQDLKFQAKEIKTKSKNKSKSSRRGDRIPAFAHNTKGGVFGFRKH